MKIEVVELNGQDVEIVRIGVVEVRSDLTPAQLLAKIRDYGLSDHHVKDVLGWSQTSVTGEADVAFARPYQNDELWGMAKTCEWLEATGLTAVSKQAYLSTFIGRKTVLKKVGISRTILVGPGLGWHDPEGGIAFLDTSRCHLGASIGLAYQGLGWISPWFCVKNPAI